MDRNHAQRRAGKRQAVDTQTMPETSQMPKSVHGDISSDVVGEALLQHYNVDIDNPWFELGVSDQETYNRRQLPWAGNSYSVSGGTVTGPNVEALPQGLMEAWGQLAKASQRVLKGNEPGDLESLYDRLESVGDNINEIPADMRKTERRATEDSSSGSYEIQQADVGETDT